MKKILFVMAIMVGAMFTSCGRCGSSDATTDSTAVDSVDTVLVDSVDTLAIDTVVAE